ncbi:hypothetical protein Tco_0134329 [Tanacetum coccineum]
MPLRSIGNMGNRRVMAPNVNFEMQSSVEICLHYGGILVRRRQGFDYIGGDSVMICGVNTYEFFYNQLLSWVVENVNCPDVGVVCYRVPVFIQLNMISKTSDIKVPIYEIELEKTAFGVDCGKSYEMDSRSSKPKCFWPLYTMPTAEENPGGCLDMDSFDNEVDMFIIDVVTYHGLDVNCMNVDDFVKSHVVADVNDAVKLYETEDMNPVGDIYNKRSVLESCGIENKSEHKMADIKIGVIGWETEMTDVEASNGKIVKTLEEELESGHKDPKIEDEEWNKEDEEKKYEENEDEKDDDEDESEEEDEENEEEEEDDDEAEVDDGEDAFFKPMKFIDDSDEQDSDYDRSPTLAECEKFASKFDGLPDQEEEQDKDSQDNCNSDED